MAASRSVAGSSACARTQERSRFWIEPNLDGMELLSAKYVTQNFAPHTHEGYALGIIEDGAQVFRYRRARHLASAECLVAINPGELHTGQAAGDGGWTYRMLYPSVDLVREIARDALALRDPMPVFSGPVWRDQSLVAAVKLWHRGLEAGSVSALARDSFLIGILKVWIERYSPGAPNARPVRSSHPAAMRARDYLHAHFAENVSLRRLSAAAHLSPYELLRVFQKFAGVPPHAYLHQLRIYRSKALLSAGQPIALVALEVGYSDQSHFARRFKRLVGVPPAHYRKAAISDKTRASAGR